MSEETPAYVTTPEPPATFERLIELERYAISALREEAEWDRKMARFSQLAQEAEDSMIAARAACSQIHAELVELREALAQQAAAEVKAS